MYTARTHATHRRDVPARVALGALTFIALAACSDDPLSSGPEALNQVGPDLGVSTLAASNTWEAKASMLTARRGLVTATVNGLVYGIGGKHSDGTTLQTVEVYNPASNISSAKTVLPAPRFFASGAAVINGEIYVPGGFEGTTRTNTLFIYNPAGNSFRQDTLPTVSHSGVSAAINGKLYLFTPGEGHDGGSPRLDRYDPLTKTWTELATPPQDHFRGAGGVINGKFYVVGGGNSSSFASARLDVYNPATNTWTRKAPMPTARISAGGRVLGGKLYVVGGIGNNQRLRAVEVYDPQTNTWAKKADMPTARSDVAVASANGLLYAVGGFNDGTTFNTIEAYTP